MTSLQKLDPRYTVSLRGVDSFGAMAAITGVSASGFNVTGVFRDAADFAVVVLYDADDFFGHPRIKYLPDFDLSGLVLSFDLTYSGLQPIDSAKFPTIDWPYLDVAKADGTTAQISLFQNATLAGGTYGAASQVFTIAAAPAVAFDRVTLWFGNFAFDFNAVGGETADVVATAIAALINAVDWAGSQAISATASGPDITITAQKPGSDGNMIGLYAQSKTGTLTISPAAAQLGGGSSDATWNVRLDFTALGIDQVRQMWITLAPPLANGAAYAGNEWSATISNWNVSGGNRALQVAGPGSVRIEETDSWCSFTGSSWGSEAGFFSKGFAAQAVTAGDSVTVRYVCQSTHDLFLGTSLYSDRGKWSVSLDGDVQTILDTRLAVDSAVNTRRLLRAGVTSGAHTVVLTCSGGGPVYFDFLEAAVRSDVPDPPGPWVNVAPAVDYDTAHGYQLPPGRLVWMLQQLGYAGEIDFYIGVFWWMQKMRSGGTTPGLMVDFSQTTYSDGTGFFDGDQIFVNIGGALFGKSFGPFDTASSIAQHFAYFINETAAGVWAQAVDSILTVTLRAAGSAYNFSFAAYVNTPATPLTFTGALSGAVASDWVIDPSQAQSLNVAVRAWMSDFYSLCAAAGLGVCSAYSMELVEPPDAWVAQYPDGTLVTTDTGFASLSSSQCVPMNPDFLTYQQGVYVATAAIMQAAGLPVILQFGEFLWWYFANASGMAYYDATTKAAALVALNRPLHIYLTPNDNPSIIGFADADFLRNRLRDHVAAIAAFVKSSFPSAQCEVLYPYDVNYPKPAGVDGVGGQLNYYVNTPPEWMRPGTLDRIKVEALDRGASSRNLDLAIEAMKLALGWNWSPGLVRYLMPIFNGGCPWEREYLAQQGLSLAGLTLFAMDHQCLFGWELGTPLIAPTAQLLGN